MVLEVAGDDLGRFLASEVFGPLDLAMVMDLEVAIAATCTSPESASRLVTDGDPERELLDIWAATV